ncbi:MAG TPA: hemerythrin domain-containing protein [Candidatus Binataceae bacterium]|nr:hemerythrin domain-containing protein [Candidatus Binataceae bacterium]
MSEITVTIHNYHERLLRDLREQSAMFNADPSEESGSKLLALLHDDLIRHTADEERDFYPLIDQIIKAEPGGATASMVIDHEFIGEYVDWIEAALQSLRSATGSHRELLLSQLRRYLVQLEAVLNLHMEKEERLFLPMIERHVSLVNQQRMLAAMNGTAMNGSDGDLPVDGKAAAGKSARKKAPSARAVHNGEAARSAGDKHHQPRR